MRGLGGGLTARRLEPELQRTPARQSRDSAPIEAMPRYGVIARARASAIDHSPSAPRVAEAPHDGDSASLNPLSGNPRIDAHRDARAPFAVCRVLVREQHPAGRLRRQAEPRVRVARAAERERSRALQHQPQLLVSPELDAKLPHSFGAASDAIRTSRAATRPASSRPPSLPRTASVGRSRSRASPVGETR